MKADASLFGCVDNPPIDTIADGKVMASDNWEVHWRILSVGQSGASGNWQNGNWLEGGKSGRFRWQPMTPIAWC